MTFPDGLSLDDITLANDRSVTATRHPQSSSFGEWMKDNELVLQLAIHGLLHTGR